MKKTTIFTIFILLLLLIGCKQAEKSTSKEINLERLNELQIKACDAADSAQSCNFRLADLGIITAKECCNTLGKCC